MLAAQAELSLDERLIRIALDILEEDGLAALSLREVARRAGVSHAAPQRHFASLRDLRAEVAARGFQLLADAVEGSAEALPPGSGALARLRAAGRAYIRVALAHPDLFELMFRHRELEAGNASFGRCADAAFQQLVSHVRAAQDTGWNVHRDTRTLAGAVWAGVHGLATLWAQGAMPGAIRHEDLDHMIETTLELVLRAPEGDPA